MLSQMKHFRQRIIKYLESHTVTETAIRFRVSRKTVYKRLHRYDGTLESLEDRSHRPHSSPRAHTKEEIKNIMKCIKNSRMISFWLFRQCVKNTVIIEVTADLRESF